MDDRTFKIQELNNTRNVRHCSFLRFIWNPPAFCCCYALVCGSDMAAALAFFVRNSICDWQRQTLHTSVCLSLCLLCSCQETLLRKWTVISHALRIWSHTSRQSVTTTFNLRVPTKVPTRMCVRVGWGRGRWRG